MSCRVFGVGARIVRRALSLFILQHLNDECAYDMAYLSSPWCCRRRMRAMASASPCALVDLGIDVALAPNAATAARSSKVASTSTSTSTSITNSVSDYTSVAMLLPRILAPVRASICASSKLAAPSNYVLEALRTANASSNPGPILTLSLVRHASHQSQGRANGAKDGPGKRLGAKKSGGMLSLPCTDTNSAVVG